MPENEERTNKWVRRESYAEIVVALIAVIGLAAGGIMAWSHAEERASATEKRVTVIEAWKEETTAAGIKRDQMLHDILCAVDGKGRDECVKPIIR